MEKNVSLYDSHNTTAFFFRVRYTYKCMFYIVHQYCVPSDHYIALAVLLYI